MFWCTHQQNFISISDLNICINWQFPPSVYNIHALYCFPPVEFHFNRKWLQPCKHWLKPCEHCKCLDVCMCLYNCNVQVFVCSFTVAMCDCKVFVCYFTVAICKWLNVPCIVLHLVVCSSQLHCKRLYVPRSIKTFLLIPFRHCATHSSRNPFTTTCISTLE